MSINLSSAFPNTSTDASSANWTLTIRGQALRGPIMLSLVVPTLCALMWGLYDILVSNGLTGLELAQLVLGGVLLGWLTLAFWTAVIGFVLKLAEVDPLSLRRNISVARTPLTLQKRHAIVMPVYNEDTRRIMVGFEAVVRELLASSQSRQFDFFMLSDTQDMQLAKQELQAWKRLSRRLGEHKERIFYRRRQVNTGRKVGNLKDFCERWGAHYEGMIVLDADSVMTGQCMQQLAGLLESNDGVALIQTIPMPVRQKTFFGRFVQFASHLYSPMLATGLSFWQTDRANYWGHNAIVRIAPFMQHCGLPAIPGKGPVSGDILSHDFVEAALLRRAGWQCVLMTELTGSYEEVPSNLVDYAVRDRRWVQGNIQHLGLLGLSGLRLTNRLHFALGAFAYISSLLLMLLLVLGSVDAWLKATSAPAFFTQPYQLFPEWQVHKPDMMIATTLGTAGLLFIPKLLGILLALVKMPAQFGGVWALLKGALVELWFAMLIAPLMMFFHSYFVLSVLVGHKVSWDAQTRDGRALSWSEAFRRTRVMSCVALSWGIVTWYVTPAVFCWLLPVLSGLFLAAPILRWSSSARLGRLFHVAGIMVINAEFNEPMALKRLRVGLRHFVLGRSVGGLPMLPPTRFTPMPVQPLFKPEPRAKQQLVEG